MWNKHTVQAEARKAHEEVIELSHRTHKVGDLERPFAMFQIGRDSEVGNNEQEKNKEGTAADRPGEADRGYQVDSHEREYDASNG